MKYGIIVQNYGKKAIQMSGYNLGDGIQSYAVLELYKEMGILEDQICEIQLCDINSYNGEYVILPMISMAIGISFAELPLSPKIIPVFISSHFAITELSQRQIDYLKTYAPIGCRDEYSLNTMRKYGIPAYLTGCITAIFPKEAPNNSEKIYCIDIPNQLKNFIPEDYRDNVVFDTHLINIPTRPMTYNDAVNLDRIAIQRLETYKNDASIVVSSRMHALVPCMAMGIPVIAVFENISYRFSWLDKFIPFYTPDNFDTIDWNPTRIDYENIKITIKNVFENQIRMAYEKYASIYTISDFYENRIKATYGNHYRRLLSQIGKDRSESFQYIIWGCGLIGNNVYDEMLRLYPNAKLKLAIDEYKIGEWHNVCIKPSSELINYPDCFIIIATYSGKEHGYEMMKKLKKTEEKDFIYVGTTSG